MRLLALWVMLPSHGRDNIAVCVLRANGCGHAKGLGRNEVATLPVHGVGGILGMKKLEASLMDEV